MDIQKSGNPLAIIGAAVVDLLVDSYATPDGVAAILNGIPPRANPVEHSPQPDNAPSANSPGVPASTVTAVQEAPRQPPMTSAGYRGLNTFVVTYQHGAGDARYSAIFQRDGLVSWKLVAIDLNG